MTEFDQFWTDLTKNYLKIQLSYRSKFAFILKIRNNLQIDYSWTKIRPKMSEISPNQCKKQSKHLANFAMCRKIGLQTWPWSKRCQTTLDWCKIATMGKFMENPSIRLVPSNVEWTHEIWKRKFWSKLVQGASFLGS